MKRTAALPHTAVLVEDLIDSPGLACREEFAWLQATPALPPRSARPPVVAPSLPCLRVNRSQEPAPAADPKARDPLSGEAA